MATFTSNSYQGRCLTLTIDQVKEPEYNRSRLDWTLTCSGGTSTYYTVAPTSVAINETTVYSKDATYWSDKVFPAKAGSESGSIYVYHDNDGTCLVDVSFKTRVYESLTPIEYGDSYYLSPIDQQPPTVSASAANITSTTVEITATPDSRCDRWYYSLNNGATWTLFSSSTEYSKSTTITGLTPGTTYNIKVKVRKYSNDMTAESDAIEVKTLSALSVNSCPDFYADASTAKVIPNVTLNDGSLSIGIQLKQGDTVVVSKTGISWTAGTSDRTVSLTATQRNAILTLMQSVTSMELKIIVTAYSGSTQVGQGECNIKALTSQDTSAPTFTNFTYTAAQTLQGSIIKSHSTITVTATAATAKNGASISSYSVKVGDKTVSSPSTTIAVGTVEASGTLDISVSAVDSRGYSTTVTKQISVLPYDRPKITTCNPRRTDGIGSVMRLTFYGTMSKVMDGNVDTNSIVAAYYQFKKTNEETYGQSVSILQSVVRSADGKSFSFQTDELCEFDTDKSYNLKIVITDKLESFEGVYVVPQGTPLVALRQDKVGINNPSPGYAVDVVGDINASGGFYINGVNALDFIYPVGAVYISASPTSPALLFGGSWLQIEDRFLIAASGGTRTKTRHFTSRNNFPVSGAEDTTYIADDTGRHYRWQYGGYDVLYEEGATGGSAELQAHTHTIDDHTHSIPQLTGSTNSKGSHTHEYGQGSPCRAADGSKWNTAGSGASTYSDETGSAGSHSHTVTIPSSTTGSGGGGETSSTGDGNDGNMPPYLAVYMWQRIA